MVLKKLFKKKDNSKAPKGFHSLTIRTVEKITSDSVRVSFEVPEELKSNFEFVPGQYLDFSIQINNKEQRRSYSICSGKNEDLAVAVKKVDTGLVSTWFNTAAQVGEEIFVAEPQGSFVRTNELKSIVTFAAGSGITPILSIAKSLSEGDQMALFYGNKTMASTLFLKDLQAIDQVKTKLFLSQENHEHAVYGRLDKTAVSEIIKENLDILKADAFFLCGPNEMIDTISEQLTLFGVPKTKIKREFFTAPVDSKKATNTATDATQSLVTVVLDGEEIEVIYVPNGKSVLELLDVKGYDPPYSCRGGVCSTCRAVVKEGTATMRMNYVLTDEEVSEGHILCCQAIPTSEKVTISFDA